MHKMLDARVSTRPQFRATQILTILKATAHGKHEKAQHNIPQLIDKVKKWIVLKADFGYHGDLK